MAGAPLDELRLLLLHAEEKARYHAQTQRQSHTSLVLHSSSPSLAHAKEAIPTTLRKLRPHTISSYVSTAAKNDGQFKMNVQLLNGDSTLITAKNCQRVNGDGLRNHVYNESTINLHGCVSTPERSKKTVTACAKLATSFFRQHPQLHRLVDFVTDTVEQNSFADAAIRCVRPAVMEAFGNCAKAHAMPNMPMPFEEVGNRNTSARLAVAACGMKGNGGKISIDLCAFSFRSELNANEKKHKVGTSALVKALSRAQHKVNLFFAPV